MIRISRYKYPVDVQNENDLNIANAYIALEFEYDNKIYVCWTGAGMQVKHRIGSLICKALNPIGEKSELDIAIQKSLYITLTVIPITDSTMGKQEIQNGLKDLINKYKSYVPYGYNTINNMRDRAYTGRHVFQYKKSADNVYTLVKEWHSVQEYIDYIAPYKINKSMIYMCCNGQRRTAYDSVWRYENAGPVIEIAPDLRTQSEYRRGKNQQRLELKKAEAKAEAISQISQRRQQFIADNIKDYEDR